MPVPPVRPITQANGEWVIQSIGDSIPTFSEILMAHIMAEDHFPLTIDLPRQLLRLVTTPGMGAWVWTRKPD